MLDKVKIIQAPMSGVTTPNFVAASCEAGALGFIAGGYATKSELKLAIQEIRMKTVKPFGVNLFVQNPPLLSKEVFTNACEALQSDYTKLNLTASPNLHFENHFNEQIQAVIEEDVKIISFTFGLPNQTIIDKLKKQHVFLIGMATTKNEALAIAHAGFDAIVLQGSEAGGHRGTFQMPFDYVPLHQLIRETRPLVTLPLIAAGGLMTATQIQEVLNIGADTVQIGTALLVAKECEIPIAYKQAILNSTEHSTTFITAYTGKPARGLPTAFTNRIAENCIAPYPYQYLLTRDILKANQTLKNPDYFFYLMGEHSHQAREGSIQEIMSSLQIL
ncbi:NAD(P)H-dependent flavin oxidoreductase [Kurthia populi]|uniref:Probable nitronate monooxygenase n=1 Tax=Kurthia populi TaxID=1562132 RepID=A0ABW5Y4J2_9BACL|nr:nitronate monooxygenase [Candidatus Kurthia intestinigallinarum]